MDKIGFENEENLHRIFAEEVIDMQEANIIVSINDIREKAPFLSADTAEGFYQMLVVNGYTCEYTNLITPAGFVKLDEIIANFLRISNSLGS